MRHTGRAAVIAAMMAVPGAGALAQDSGGPNCGLITAAAASGIANRIQADDRDIAAPRSVTTFSCLDGFFSGIGLNVVTNLLDPGSLLTAVEGKICSAILSTWNALTGSVQCGLTVTGFDVGFGGFGGGNFCPNLSFGGGGPTWGSAGLGGSNSSGGVTLNGTPMAPTGYPVPPNSGSY